MKKIAYFLLGCLLLTGCDKNGTSSSSNNINSTSSSSSITNTSTTIDSSKKQEYYTTAISNLFLSYEGIDILVEATIESEKVESTTHIYYDIVNYEYQIQSNDSYITFQDNHLYIDNANNHYKYETGEFDSSILLILMGTLQSIDVNNFELVDDKSSILLTHTDENNTTYNIYLEEDLLVNLTKFEIINENLKLSIIPNNELEMVDISNFNHINLKEDLAFLEQYFEYLGKENLDYAFAMDFNHMDLEVNMSQRAVTDNEVKTYIFNGDISYKYLKNELFFEIKDNVLYYEEEQLPMENLMGLLEENINPNSLMDFAIYFVNIANSELIIEDNLITFESTNFIEEISFEMTSEGMIIESLYLDLILEVKEVIE